STFRQLFRPPFEFRLLLDQLYNVGVGSLSIVIVTGIVTGMLLAVGTYYQMRRFAAEGLMGGVVAMATIKELGPILTATVLSSRIGASITAELGVMRVTEQIDAMEAMAVNPIKYLVVPRLLACTIMLPILTAFSDCLAILGGMGTSTLLFGLNPRFFLQQAKSAIHLNDLIVGIVKSACFGMAIATISCYKGLAVNPAEGAEGVGRATTGSAVVSFMVVLIIDFMIDQAIHGVVGMR
ncbi:ABC transporter permease, partial [Candidatus Poribacteria bacterium]